jgi:acyl-coenzyme A thioesterase PaaI-like protein
MIARGRVVKAGRRTTVTQAEVFAETTGQEKLVGLVTATFINGTGREDT